MKIGIATAFSSMMDFYSLTSVVHAQMKMIVESGHRAVFIVMDDFGWHNCPPWAQRYIKEGRLVVRKVIKNFHKLDYMSVEKITPEHVELSKLMEEQIAEATKDLDAVLAHDLLFTGWNLPINLAIREVCTRENQPPWFHWVHSVPSGRRDYWKLPEKSWLVYPNHEDRIRCAEAFGTWKENVLVIPHCSDLRDWMITSPIAHQLITEFDVFSADLVQVYPVPSDRLDAKGIPWVIQLFGMFKKLGKSVRLVCPNAWCTIPQWKQKVEELMELAKRNELTEKEVIFTSRWNPQIEVGLPMSDIRDLVLCGNIFICPPMSETFGLSLAEAASLGNLLVLNEDLPMLKDVVGGAGNAIWAKFGSCFYQVKHQNPELYYHDICQIILHHLDYSHEYKAKTHYRQNYRREAVWNELEKAVLASKLVKV